MAITKVSQCFKRAFRNKITGEQSGRKVYQVFSNTAYTDLDSLVVDAVAAGVPALGTSYSATSTTLIAIDQIPIEIQNELKIYYIEVEYGSDNLNYAFPTSRPWNISFYSILTEYTPYFTKFDSSGAGLPIGNLNPVGIGKPIFNTAGFPFTDPPVTDLAGSAGIRLQKNFTNINAVGDSTITNIYQLMSLMNNVNDDAVTIAGITGAKASFWIREISAANVKENGQSYYDITFDIVYDPELHIAKVLNAGFMDKNRKKFRTVKGTPVQRPQPIDINGDLVPGDEAARIANSIYLGFGVKPYSSFSALNLPTTF